MKEYYDTQIIFLSGEVSLVECETEPELSNGMLIVKETKNDVDMFNTSKIEKVYYSKGLKEDTNES